LRIVSGLSVQQIARAFLVGDSAMEQRITRAKRRVADAGVAFETPGAVERSERLGTVAAMIYLLFNEGYSASGGDAHLRLPLCEEAIRLARLLLRLFPSEPEMLGLTALLLFQHARSPARLDVSGAIVLLEDQDRARWRKDMIAEGEALIDKAMRHRRPGPYQIQAAIAALLGTVEGGDADVQMLLDFLAASTRGISALMPSAARLVTGDVSPQGTMPAKCVRSGSTLRLTP